MLIYVTTHSLLIVCANNFVMDASSRNCVKHMVQTSNEMNATLQINNISILHAYITIMSNQRVIIYLNKSKCHYMRPVFKIVISFLCVVDFRKWFGPHFRQIIIIEYICLQGFNIRQDQISAREFCRKKIKHC